MCTAITYKHYFGRNLDLERGYGEQVVICPRNHRLLFKNGHELTNHYALIGMAAVADDYPLLFDATNEHGLSMAGLDFPGNAHYNSPTIEGINVTSFELIPWILGQCNSLQGAKRLLVEINITDVPFSGAYPPSPLHWMIADRTGSLVVEPMSNGLKIYENPVGVLTNNPPFPYHLYELVRYRHLSAGENSACFEGLTLPPYGGGMDAIGLPGDYSSSSRFVRAAFHKNHSHSNDANDGDITQFFHIMATVAMPRGAIRVRNHQDEITRYTSCCDASSGIYYYTTYENNRIQAVKMRSENLSGNRLICYPLHEQQDILYCN